jgi:hypothetical protein
MTSSGPAHGAARASGREHDPADVEARRRAIGLGRPTTRVAPDVVPRRGSPPSRRAGTFLAHRPRPRAERMRHAPAEFVPTSPASTSSSARGGAPPDRGAVRAPRTSVRVGPLAARRRWPCVWEPPAWFSRSTRRPFVVVGGSNGASQTERAARRGRRDARRPGAMAAARAPSAKERALGLNDAPERTGATLYGPATERARPIPRGPGSTGGTETVTADHHARPSSSTVVIRSR